ncbi:NAD(P) transhydrogenase subunit alpha [Dyella caseinilytica]|uniref:proton-translocating NAD(P)(+) transhydrogenase n=1 Tax=Dyella caseinilytica TaxID=1849581 RepID=A0ABX7GRJ2_9GAMM|nr:NAD(P) transhydrogenase subunit alpha [Dyella caseinilytica]QRN52693.1 NAD(P) transhydrogenase subunit alpha [Dyella caseinilytica]GGA07950.1 putative NAD(P) transhydrogenase, alpha1 subunit PntAA [Dyella caseinilytica]
MSITVSALRETVAGERRVAITPEVAKKLRGKGVRVLLEHSAGAAAGFPDASYADVEFADADQISREADLLACVLPPDDTALARLREGCVIVGQLRPHDAATRIRVLAEYKLTAFSLELLPRTTRAQAMDVLSSQAAVAGYRAMLIAAENAPKFFPMLTTAAGTIRPSRVLVIGAGVAGLQAIATARRLGAQIEGYDVRPETREQVESLGAKFLQLGVSAAGSGGYARELTAEERAAQQQALAEHLKVFDVVVSTAAVPGRPAPKILTAAMVDGMKPGALIVDLAAESGGNCELTRPGERVVHDGVVILGPLNLAAGAPLHASEMYARNIYNFAELLIRDGALKPDFDDELVAKSCVVRQGEILLKA